MEPTPNPTRQIITVKQLLEEYGERLQLRLVAGQPGLIRIIRERDLTRPALALAGFFEDFRYDRVQILGNTENKYLRSLEPAARAEQIGAVFSRQLPLVILTDSNHPIHEVQAAAEFYDVPLATTSLSTTELSSSLVTILDEYFAPTVDMHGVLVDVYGVGVLISGSARAGKSELALDLVERGHRLVADDIVQVSLRMAGVIMGRAPELLKHLLEVRGIGIVDVEKMFGVRAVRVQKRIEVVLELVHDASEDIIERLGLENLTIDILGIPLPLVQLPVLPGKYLTVLAEIVALNHLLRVNGVNSAEEFIKRQQQEIDRKRVLRSYLQGDYE